ncbi:MAG TPA: pyruvate dehydrogenase complex dihydrolipoamide acetyltransferase [Pseudolabrys sp.]|nr:pyruvate dehydrogenase complex dihydrolipoamide acetyltransferase [Pseudolabrys sp.]
MPTNILMPALSPTMEKGNLAKWLKKEGDKVSAGDVLAEIETDKATMEYEAVDEGTLAKIVVPEGTQDVAVNSVIGVLAGVGEDVKAAAASAKAEAPKKEETKPPEKETRKAEPKPASSFEMRPAAAPQDEAQRVSHTEARRSPHPEEPAEAPAKARVSKGEGVRADGRVFSSPLARRLAKEAGIDIARVQGSGPHGRIIARDIEAAKSGKGLAPQPATAPAAKIAPAMTDQQVLSLFEEGSYELVPHDGMRRTIAERLTAAAQTIPHFYLTVDCDIGKLVTAREEINAAAPKDKDGKPAYKLSVNDFVVKALALAFQRVPQANVSWTDAAMVKHKHSDIGVAVALPGGLITPIVRQAETKSLSAISNELRDLVQRARARRLKPHEYQGGTSAVSNLGMYGIKDFTAVINPPHSTILAVGTGEERPVVRDGKIVVANLMSVTLSCDHRSVDGALGAELIGAFKLLIENPVTMVV